MLRPLFLAAAGVLAELALLPQSRGAVFAFPVVLLLYLALVPGRVRTVVFLAPVGLALAVSARRLLDVGDERTGGRPGRRREQDGDLDRSSRRRCSSSSGSRSR